MEGEANGAVGEHVFLSRESLEPCRDFGLFDDIGLKEPVQLFSLSPASFVVVVSQIAFQEIAHHGEPPIRKLYEKAPLFLLEESRGTELWRRQMQSFTCGTNGFFITDFGLDRNEMAHGECFPFWLEGGEEWTYYTEGWVIV